MSQENVEIVRRLFGLLDALGGHLEPDEVTDRLSDAVLGEFFDREAEWVPVPQGVLAGGTYKGFDGIRRFFTDFVAAWDALRAEPQEFIDLGDQVVAIVRISGRMRDLEIDEVWSGVYGHRDGKIVRVQGFVTREGALEAAGLRE